MEVTTEVCRYCRRDIPDYSILTHEAHCERGHRLKNGQLLSPEPRSPSPMIEEPSECSVVSTPGDLEVTTLALDQTPSWPSDVQDKPKQTTNSNVTYIPIQMPNNGKFDSYIYNLDNGQGQQYSKSETPNEGKTKFDFSNDNMDNFDKPKHEKQNLTSPYGVKNSWLYPKRQYETIPEQDSASNKSGSSIFDPGTSKSEPSMKEKFVNSYVWDNIPETVLNFKSENKETSPPVPSTLKNLLDDIESLPDLESIKSGTSNIKSPDDEKDFDLESLKSGVTASTLKLGDDSPRFKYNNFKNQQDIAKSPDVKDLDVEGLKSGATASTLKLGDDSPRFKYNGFKSLQDTTQSPEPSVSSLNFGRLKSPDSESVKSDASTSTLKLGDDATKFNFNRLKSQDDFEADSLKSGPSTPSTVFDLSLNSPEDLNLDKNSVKSSPVFDKDLDSPGTGRKFGAENDGFKFGPDLGFGQTRTSPGNLVDGTSSNGAEECLTRKTPEKAPGVTCPDCHRMQKAGGLRHHLDEECQFRSKPCPFCDVPYRARDLECHMVVCGTRSEKCPDCEEMIMIKYKHIHLESNHGFIKLDDEPDNTFTWTPLPRLPLRPPDLIRNIPLSTKDEDAKASIPCEFCEEVFPAYRLTVHQLGCRLKQQTNEKTSKSQQAAQNSPTTTKTNKTTYDYPVHLSPPPSTTSSTPVSRKNKAKAPQPPQPKTIYHHIPTIVDALPKYSPEAPSTSRVTPIVHHIPTVIQPAPRIGRSNLDVRPPTRYTTSVHHIPTVVQTKPKVHYIPTVLEGSPRYHYVHTNGVGPKEHYIPITQETSKPTKKATKSNSAPLTPNGSPGIDVISFGNVLEVSDKFKNDWKNLEQKIKDNSKDDLHVIPCEYCSKMLRIGEVMSHQMLCFLQQ